MRPQFPMAEYALLVRTCFSNEVEWARLLGVINTPSDEGFKANVGVINDASYDGAEIEEILEAVQDVRHSAIIVMADSATLEDDCLPLLIVDLVDVPGRSIRAAAEQLWRVENNLGTANMDFEEFEEALDGLGIFRGW